MKTINRTTDRQKLHRIRKNLANLEKKIKELTEKLIKVETALDRPDEFDDAEIRPCIYEGFRVQCVIYLKAPTPKLRDELLSELAGLQDQMKSSRLRERALANRVRKGRHADHQSRDLKKRLKVISKEADKKGTLDEDELVILLEDSEGVLTNYVHLLQANASIENIDAVLKHLALPLALGGDATTGKVGEACRALDQAAKKLQKRAQVDFENVPSVWNFDRLLIRTRIAMMLGESELPLPQGLVRVNKTHKVAPGESLASIAKHYYGKTVFWPYIYMKNFSKIDPTKLPAGISIYIP